MSQLKSLGKQYEHLHLNELFAAEPERFQKYSVHFDQLLFDYSKHRVNQTVLDQLVTLANAKQLKPWIERLFSQEKVNCTEQRAAMHWALRLPEGHAQFPELTKQVHLQLERPTPSYAKPRALTYAGS